MSQAPGISEGYATPELPARLAEDLGPGAGLEFSLCPSLPPCSFYKCWSQAQYLINIQEPHLTCVPRAPCHRPPPPPPGHGLVQISIQTHSFSFAALHGQTQVQVLLSHLFITSVILFFFNSEKRVQTPK